MIFRQRYFGTFVSGGFIVMAYAKEGVPSPFFRPFFNATGKGTRFRKQEKYDVGFFCRYRTFPIFLFFVSFSSNKRETDARAGKVG